MDLLEVQGRIEANLAAMGDLEGQETVVTYMTLTKLLEQLRETSYQMWGHERIVQAYESVTGRQFDKTVQKREQNLAGCNEENISLLYNLSFIAFLATSYNNARLSTTAKRLVSMRVNKIVEKIAS